MIKLWTFQTAEAYEKLENQGYLIGRRELIEPLFVKAYNWLNQQMMKRIGEPPHEGQYPMWAWHRCDEIDNLERGGHLVPGTRGVRIEFEIDAKSVLLSDFDSWHYVLNHWYLPASESDGDAFELELKQQGLYSLYFKKSLPHNFNQRIEASWDRIFNLTDYSTQATFWKLESDQVLDVKWFTAEDERIDCDDD